MKTFLGRFAWLTTAAAFLVCPAVPSRAGEHPVAPGWQLKDVDGQAVKLSDFKGKVIILDFWATWCPPCREEIPGFISLQKKYGPRGLAIIGVSTNDAGTKAVSAFMRQVGINYRVVLGDPKVSFLYGGVEVIPTTFVIDRAGRVATAHSGYTDPATIEAEIKPLL